MSTKDAVLTQEDWDRFAATNNVIVGFNNDDERRIWTEAYTNAIRLHACKLDRAEQVADDAVMRYRKR